MSRARGRDSRFAMSRSNCARRVLATAYLLLLAISMKNAYGGRVQSWRHEGLDDFKGAKAEGAVVSNEGVIRLGRSLQAASDGLECSRVWDLAVAPDGTVCAATGDKGRVYKRAGAGGAWTVAAETGESQALSLAVDGSGQVFVGTGPNGAVVSLKSPDKDKERSRPDAAVQYIWDLAFDRKGNLYAATGPTGQLWKREAGQNRWTMVLDSKHSHLLCLAIGPDQSVYAGSDGNGLVYRITPTGGAPQVVFDAPQSDVRALAVTEDGTLYVGTAQPAESSTSGKLSIRGNSRKPLIIPASYQASSEEETDDEEAPSAGENSVYRVTPNGAHEEIMRRPEMVHALLWRPGGLLVGTGPEGHVHEFLGRDRESSPLARLANGQVLALAEAPGGGVLVGAGEPAGVFALDADYRAEGTLTSEVLDAKLPARMGAVSWSQNQPEGTSVSVQVRTGYVEEPDETWSNWSSPVKDPIGSRLQVPMGRFAQYRVNLGTKAARVSPVVRSIAIRYQTVNLAPEVSKLEVPDLTQSDGSTRQTQLTLKWTASDPNDDELVYLLDIRRDGWPEWIRLVDPSKPLTENTYSWDSTSVPPGSYRLRVTASDRRANPPADALDHSLESQPFVVDHQAPAVAIAVSPNNPTSISVNLDDNLTPIVKASYAMDGGQWDPVFPLDGLFDTRYEILKIDIPNLSSGLHVIRVRATDSAGNTGASDLILNIPASRPAQ